MKPMEVLVNLYDLRTLCDDIAKWSNSLFHDPEVAEETEETVKMLEVILHDITDHAEEVQVIVGRLLSGSIPCPRPRE